MVVSVGRRGPGRWLRNAVDPASGGAGPGPSVRSVPAFLALLSSVVWGTADFVGGLVSRRRPAFAVVAWAHACALVAVLVWCAVAGAFDDPRGYLPWGIAAGLRRAGLAGLLLRGARRGHHGRRRADRRVRA